MPYTKPDIKTLQEQAVAQIEVQLPGADAKVRRSNLNVLSSVLATAVNGLYGYINWLSQQILPDTAEVEYLERHANLWGKTRKQATFATGTVTFTGLAGAVIPAGTIIQRSDNTTYKTLESAEVSGTTIDVNVQAEESGVDANIEAATTLTLVNSLALTENNIATNSITGGSDIESDDSLRNRLLEHIKSPPHGGAAQDYITWALEVSGVTRAWVYPDHLGLGTVGVSFVRDDDASIIPDSAEIQTVQDYIEDLRPVTADVTVFAPLAKTLDLEIHISPNDAVTQAAITAEIEDMLRRIAEPSKTILISHIREAVSIAAGEYDNVLVSPTANITHTEYEMAVLGTITWGAL